MSSPSHGMVVVVYQGRLWRIPKGPFESDERAYDRAWWIAKHRDAHTMALRELVSRSHMWANQKYFRMDY